MGHTKLKVSAQNGGMGQKLLWEILLRVKHTLSDNYLYREMCRFTVKIELELKEKEEFSHYLLDPMLMGSGVEFVVHKTYSPKQTCVEGHLTLYHCG